MACPYLLTSSDWRHRPASTQPALKAAHMKATSHAPRSLRYDSQNNKGGKFMMGYQALNEIRHIDNIFRRLGQAGLWPARNVLLYQTCSFFNIFQEGLPGTCLDLPETLSINPFGALDASQTTMEGFMTLELPGFSCRLSSSPTPPFAPKACKRLPQLIFI